jgi:hypothetical protein
MKQSDIQKESPSLIHRQSYLDILRNKIIEKGEDEELSFNAAATRVLLSWLGYPIDSKDLTFIDNRDNGIDAWYLTDVSIELFQVKTHNLTSEDLLQLGSFDNEGVNDLARAKNLLCFDKSSNTVSHNIKELLGHWSYILKSRKVQEVADPVLVTLNLIILGDNLTTPAQEEFNRFQKSNKKPVIIEKVAVQFNAVLYTIHSIIEMQWREENREWKDMQGNEIKFIRLSPLKEEEWINDNKNAIFYCKAIDLVNAYEDLGYQFFEPNVRAEIKKSRVNGAIRDSVKYSRTRKDFRFLNNGVTITCDSYKPPKENRKEFNVYYPGVVNGLQTVVALRDAYNELSSDPDKDDFKQNCSVLVRLLLKNAVDDITDVVRATNNQNPMKPRNLVSNSSEQIGFARIFAEQFGWFYAAKEGAWDAFSNDHRRWRPSLNKSPKDFKYKGKIRKVDNHDLAQTWLSFIGFSYTASEEKNQLFEKNRYELIFKRRTNKHGYEFGYDPGEAEKHSEEGAPDANLMLVSYLSYFFAQSIVPSSKKNRIDACERLGAEINKSLKIDDYTKLNTQELDGKLFEKDDTFALNQVLRYMPFLFTDFVGFILFSALGKNIHSYGQKILSNHSFDLLKCEIDTELIKQKIDTKTFEKKGDLLVILWLMFYEKIEEWMTMTSDWKQSYRNADRKPRFVLSINTRKRLYKDIIELDGVMKMKKPARYWAVGAEEGQGLFEFIKKCVFEKIQ